MITISGHSDDIICVDGDMVDEWEWLKPGPAFVRTDNGCVVRVQYGYGEGYWLVAPEHMPHGIVWQRTAATDIDADYTDRLSIGGARRAWLVEMAG